MIDGSVKKSNFYENSILSYLLSTLSLARDPRCLAYLTCCCSVFLSPHLDMSELAPLDADLVADVLSKHPFIKIDGVYNVRDLGMIPVADGKNVTRSGFMYRSGELSGVTQHGVRLPFFPFRVHSNPIPESR